ncbi:MAG: diguanylate cyclase [Nitrospirota bacterium]
MKKDVLIYENDKDNLNFLSSFFKKRKDYSPHFFKNRHVLKKRLSEKRPDVIIISSPEGLRYFKPSEINCPMIALISSNIVEGIRSVVKADIEYYLIGPFHEEELDQKLKLAVSKKNLLDNIHKSRKYFDALVDLVDFAYLIPSSLEPKEILRLVVEKISKVINVTRCSILSIELEDQKYARVVSTFDNPKATDLKLDLQKYPEIRKVLSNKKPVIIKDVLKDPLMREVREIIKPIGIRSIIVVPIIFRNEAIGTLLLKTSRAGYTFTRQEIRLCTAIVNTSSIALYNALLYSKLEKDKTRFEKLALMDYLTGIYNIRYFYHRLEEEFSRAMRYNTPLSCIILDLDHFKKINDIYGHRVGDIVLREFAQLVRGCLRKSDIFARYGGEEFIILLPHAILEGAIDKAEQIRKTVREYQFMGLDEGYKVTISIGISFISDEGIKTYDDLINCADNALYIAKNKGRDQVTVYSSK